MAVGGFGWLFCFGCSGLKFVGIVVVGVVVVGGACGGYGYAVVVCIGCWLWLCCGDLGWLMVMACHGCGSDGLFILF